ncbi:uncharacterized protein LOC141679382 [Apium graveolens]|uniref:uncharacterized protein LOC141679382 n=1 Tax=Apium graveolens TaxID=4045 RepID=UPI003D7AAF4C
MYVCCAELKKAWKEGCRPVLGLDGCFLKTVCGGQLLSAVGRDGNNSIFPVTMTVVESESYDSWKWFLMLLGDDLDLHSGYAQTFISDQQKFKELFPHAEHRNCTRHIYSNLQGKHASEAVRNAFFEASTVTHPQAFKSAMKDLEMASKKAFYKMSQLEPNVWSKAYFETHCKTDSTENNISECFNSWILISRYMPIIDMLTEIHDMIMERLYEKRDAMKLVYFIVLPKIKRILDDCVKENAECSVL